MAFNWATFRTRAFTALIFVAVMMFGLLYNPWSLFALIAVIYFGCWWEYCSIIQKITGKTLHIYAKHGAGLLGFHIVLLLGAGHLQSGGYNVQQNFSLPILIAGLVLFIWGIFKTGIVSKRLLLWLLGGLLYIALPLGLLLHLSSKNNYNLYLNDTSFKIAGKHMVLFIIGSLWLNDTMAYLAGSVIGKTPLSKISPKKTWEGTISGVVLSALLTWVLFSIIFLKNITWALAAPGIAISALAAVTGTLGDLWESKLKRMAGVKDSGSIMPGHGGFLDRFDSLLLAVPAVWLLVYVFTN